MAMPPYVQGYIVSSLATAQALAAQVDANLGYPSAGVNVGGGVHIVPTPITQTYQHAYHSLVNATQWSYVADSVTTPVVSVGPNAVRAGAPSTLDASWNNATVAT